MNAYTEQNPIYKRHCLTARLTSEQLDLIRGLLIMVEQTDDERSDLINDALAQLPLTLEITIE